MANKWPLLPGANTTTIPISNRYLVYAVEAQFFESDIAGINHPKVASHLATRHVRGVPHVPLEERPRLLNLVLLKRRLFRIDLILAFIIFNVWALSFLFQHPFPSRLQKFSCRIL